MSEYNFIPKEFFYGGEWLDEGWVEAVLAWGVGSKHVGYANFDTNQGFYLETPESGSLASHRRWYTTPQKVQVFDLKTVEKITEFYDFVTSKAKEALEAEANY